MYKEWTNEEDIKLLELKAKGLVYKQIGRILGRTRGAINMRYLQLQKGVTYKLARKTILSEKQELVVKELIKGYSLSKISNNLYITESTIKTHLVNSFNKLGVNNRISLVLKYLVEIGELNKKWIEN